MKKVIKQKTGQKNYSNSVYKHYFKKNWDNPYKRSLIGDFVDYYPLKKAFSLLPFSLKGKKVLSICCGDGFEGEFLYKLGAEVTVTDISPEAVKAAKRRCPHLKGFAADSENLPFKKGSFDLVLVRDGLHHLPNPRKGISEMNRVSKIGFIVIEAQKNFLTRIFLKLGIALQYEISGNFVYRFTRREIKKIMRKHNIKNYKIETSWCYHVGFLSKYVYPVINNRIFLTIFTLLFYTFNYIFGYFGNSMIVVALKKGDVI